MRYTEALGWLYGTQERGIKLGLDRVRSFFEMLGWEEGDVQFLHVAGTNGKGSVCAMLDSICRSAGMRTGLFTSPHLVTFRERIRINGEMAPADDIAAELTEIRALCERKDIEPTFFEITTALALTLFRRARLNAVVLETGLGGRLDSTNIVKPKVAVITSVGLDHTQFLGETLGEIAREKAGIIKLGVPVVTGPLPPDASAVVAEIAAERGSRLIQVNEPESNYPLGLKGSHQRINAAVAIRALEEAGIRASPEQIAAGLRDVNWPARFQLARDRFILDGAHNPDAAKRLVETWREEYGAEKTCVILGVLRDKDARGLCAELAAVAEEFVIVPVRSPRARPVGELAEIASAWRPTRTCDSLEQAIQSVPGTKELPTLITGSLFLTGEALVTLGLAEGEQELSAQ